MDERFVLVGIRPGAPVLPARRRRRFADMPVIAIAFLTLLVLGCVFCRLIMTHDPTYMDLANCARQPDREFWFGTDAMGRDIFSMIWYGGRASLSIGLLAAAISGAVAVGVGGAAGLGPAWLDGLLMRLTDVLLSVPSLLVVILLQAALGGSGVVGIALAVGLTGWMSIAKAVRTQVRQLRGSGYVTAARCMGGGPVYILWRHLAPNFLSSILFMVVMNVRTAIVAESTLSFLGVGLPLEVISWGGMLSLAEGALTSGAWWIVLIPGFFLVAALTAITELGNWLRESVSRGESNL